MSVRGRLSGNTKERAARARERYYAREQAAEPSSAPQPLQIPQPPQPLQLPQRHLVRADPPAEKIGQPCAKKPRSLVRKALSATRVLASAKVPESVYKERMAACCECPHVTVARGHHWCNCCGCVQWHVGSVGSSLEYKNWKAAWRCERPEPAFGPLEPPDITSARNGFEAVSKTV